MTLFNNALEQYKSCHKVLVTNCFNHDQIYDKLKKQLALNYITNLDMIKTKPYDSTHAIYYAIGFVWIRYTFMFKKMRQIIITVKDEQKLPLPESPEAISDDIKAIFPSSSPLKTELTLIQ